MQHTTNMESKKRGRPTKVVEPKRNAMGRIIEEPEVAQPIPKDKYKLSLNVGGETYSSEGSTMLEALNSLKRPDKLMSKSILTVSTGKDSKTLLLQPARAKRFFYNSAGVQEVLAKQLETGLVK